MADYYSSYTGGQIDSAVKKVLDGGVVLTDAQTLTDAQKDQARENIGALAETELDSAIKTALAAAKESGEFDGTDGNTPVKGTDYWTEEDQAAIVADVLAALPTYDNTVEVT